ATSSASLPVMSCSSDPARSPRRRPASSNAPSAATATRPTPSNLRERVRIVPTQPRKYALLDHWPGVAVVVVARFGQLAGGEEVLGAGLERIAFEAVEERVEA